MVTTHGPLRVFSLLHHGRAALINFGEQGSVEVSGWADRVRLVDAKMWARGNFRPSAWLPSSGGVGAAGRLCGLGRRRS